VLAQELGLSEQAIGELAAAGVVRAR
jgi:hypothetical protein